MALQVSPNNPQDVISPTVEHLARLQTIIQLHDESLAAISEMVTFNDMGIAEPNDPRLDAELQKRRQTYSKVKETVASSMNTDINGIRTILMRLGGAVNNHRELLTEFYKMEGAFTILAEAEEFTEDGEGSRQFYEAALSSLRAQLDSSTLYIVRLLRESGLQVSTLVGADNGPNE